MTYLIRQLIVFRWQLKDPVCSYNFDVTVIQQEHMDLHNNYVQLQYILFWKQQAHSWS